MIWIWFTGYKQPTSSFCWRVTFLERSYFQSFAEKKHIGEKKYDKEREEQAETLYTRDREISQLKVERKYYVLISYIISNLRQPSCCHLRSGLWQQIKEEWVFMIMFCQSASVPTRGKFRPRVFKNCFQFRIGIWDFVTVVILCINSLDMKRAKLRQYTWH